MGSSSSERSVEKRVRKKPGHANKDRGALKHPNLAKAVATPKVPVLPPPLPPVRSERLPSSESDKG